MRGLVTILLIAFAFFNACQEPAGLRLVNNECRAYTDLYFFNYDSLKNDPITVDTIFIEGDCLKLRVYYSGCTRDHPINLAYLHPKCGTPPLPPPTFEIKHDSRGEGCKMLVTNELSFDISPLRAEGEDKIVFILSWNTGGDQLASREITYTY
jgi:hypothetical protein